MNPASHLTRAEHAAAVLIEVGVPASEAHQRVAQWMRDGVPSLVAAAKQFVAWMSDTGLAVPE